MRNAACITMGRSVGRIDGKVAQNMAGWASICAICASLSGCQSGILDPKGPIGSGERLILFDAMAIMLAIVVPTIIATFVFAWWFRESNRKAIYRPDWSYSGRLELLVWSIPGLVVLFLGGIGWISSHDLDPQRPLPGSRKPLEIQVISLNWKWLFIYPEQGIASLNLLVVPTETPLHFRLTSATVMNSFFVPQLGSQIYTMAGMTTQVNLQADRPGRYSGMSAQFSGDGFSDMHFTVEATSDSDFASWVRQTQSHGPTLDRVGYDELSLDSKAERPRSFRAVTPNLFEDVVALRQSSARETTHQPPNPTQERN